MVMKREGSTTGFFPSDYNFSRQIVFQPKFLIHKTTMLLSISKTRSFRPFLTTSCLTAQTKTIESDWHWTLISAICFRHLHPRSQGLSAACVTHHLCMASLFGDSIQIYICELTGQERFETSGLKLYRITDQCIGSIHHTHFFEYVCLSY